VVNNVHQAGKEVHAWTVNTAGEIERMKSLGVDCIITDKPTLAREVLYRNDKNDSLIELLNRMLYNRSFYKFVQDP
jgi:glycerophosphoryl diester phosphodiesterase